MGYFVWAVTIIKGHGRVIKIWSTKINWKVVFEEFIKCSSIVISSCNSLVTDLIGNNIIE